MPYPVNYTEVRFTTDTGAIRKAFVTSPGPLDAMVNLFVFNDPNDDITPNCCNIAYSSTITTANTWHFIADEG